MTSAQLRTEAAQPDNGADVLLDWFDDKQASTVAYEPRFLKDLGPSPIARDLLRFAGSVYCLDKVVQRSEAPDAWTRTLEVQVPVSDVARWGAAARHLGATLSFLSGDHWDLSFTADTAEAPPAPDKEPPAADAVSLFSGGLDSLAGVVDLFEANKRLVLVGHHDHPFTETGQTALETELAQHYGAAHFTRRHIYLRPAGLRQNQARRLPSGIENTTRSRSFLFLAAGVTVADAVGARVPLYVPENGFIGINVPLTGARAGSLSTRTTHPLYMARMQQLLDMLGLDHVIENPFRLLTKGELLVGSANQPLLLSLAKMSVSCSHPEALRWIGKPNGNCGWCYPCLIRRASLHHVGVDDFRDYGLDALNEVDLLKRSSGRGQSLRALATSLRQSEAIEDVVANGRIPNGETRVFYDVYKRGRDELRAWLADAGPGLSRRLGS